MSKKKAHKAAAITLRFFEKMVSNNDNYNTEGSSCTLEELDNNLDKCFNSKKFAKALNKLKRKMEFSEESIDSGGFDVEPNNYTLEQLSRDITKTEQSKEFKNLMNVLKIEVAKKYPHKIKL